MSSTTQTDPTAGAHDGSPDPQRGAVHRSTVSTDTSTASCGRRAISARWNSSCAVRRSGEREVLESAELRPLVGVVGDNYVERGDRRTPDGKADPLGELNVMSSRALEAVAGPDRGRWQLAGDQLIVDFDLSLENAPAGTRLEVGTAVIEVTTKPHNGCAKFSDRFGIDAARWINSRKDLRLRGICAVVVRPGTVQPGDQIRKLPADHRPHLIDPTRPSFHVCVKRNCVLQGAQFS